VSTRKNVADKLKPLLPKGWKLEWSRRNLDAIAVPTVIVWIDGFKPLPEAPKTKRLARGIITLVDPSTDPAKGEDSLDEEVDKLTDAIDDLRPAIPIKWTDAHRVKSGEQNPNAYDIDIEIITERGTANG
jgi:hypothetical protein